MSLTARRSTRERNAEIMREQEQAIAAMRARDARRARDPATVFQEIMHDAINTSLDLIEDAQDYITVEAALYGVARTRSQESYRIERADNLAIARRSLDIAKELAAQEVVTPEDMRRGLNELRVAHDLGELPYAELETAALTLKDKAGAALLAEKLAPAKRELEALIEGLDLPTPPVFLNDLTAQRRGAIESFKSSLGGSDAALRRFFSELEAQEPGKRRTQQTLNALYSQWLHQQALEHDGFLRQAEESAERLGRAIIDHAKGLAGISPRQAAQLAASRTRSGSGVRGVVSRAGWSPGQYDADMVELMQVAGKAVPQDARVTVGSKGDLEKAVGSKIRSGSRGRSFHSELTSTGAGRVTSTYVCLSGDVSKRTLYHEMGHAIEAVNPAANAMVARWLKGRIEGEDAKKLASLTGIRAYRRGEVAVKDHFIDPYVGKVYKPRAGVQSNEVLAMGLERLADPMAAAQLAIKDPDHLALILAALQLEYQP